MKKIILLKLLITTFLVSGQTITELKGIVKNIDKDTLVIVQSYKDVRYSGVEIPVQNGKMFQYSLMHDATEEYSIIYKSDIKNGAWKPIRFFPNGKTIAFELYPTQEYSKNKVIGDALREQQLKYQQAFSEKFSKLGDAIYGKIFQLKKDSDEYKKVKIRLDSLNEAALAFQHNYFLNDDSILGLNEYVYLLQNAEGMMISPDYFKEYQDYYLRKRFDHPLIERAVNLYVALSEVKVGHKFIEIDITDRKNKSVKLSELMDKKKYIILDLWAPWCGPCIRKSNLLKQNYSTIKTNAKIIGIVGGVDDIKKAENAIHLLEYPWENYVEIADKHQIWEKYGIANSGGAQFVIDKEGTIVAINPEIEDIKKIIDKK